MMGTRKRLKNVIVLLNLKIYNYNNYAEVNLQTFALTLHNNKHLD